MKGRFGIITILATFATAAAAPALEMQDFGLAVGFTEENRLSSPVFATDGLPAVTVGEIEWLGDRDAWIVYRIDNSVLTKAPKFKKPRFKLEAGGDLGPHFAEALSSQAKAMGFALSGEKAWRVSGRIHDARVEIRLSGGGWGPYLFYGFLDLELAVESSEGERQERRYRFFDLSHIYNAGFGAQDEAKEALARFFVESAQEAVARLNRDFFHAPPHPSVEALLPRLDSEAEDWEKQILRVGLAGSETSVEPLLALLAREKRDEDRALIINALAHIGSPSVHEALTERYAGEDEDCRLAILKALDYIGHAEGRSFIREKGPRDGDLPVRVLASRVPAE